jgi:hypothetical protein
VSVSVDATDGAIEVLAARARLAAAESIPRPFEEDEFEFRLGEAGRFTLRRSYCLGGDRLGDRV